MPNYVVKTEEFVHTATAVRSINLPVYVIAGYLLTLSLIISPLFFNGDHLNQVTISIKVVTYLLWTYTIMILHCDVRAVDSQYPYGPKESMVGAWIPFSYIFWNFFWVSQLWKKLDLGVYSIKQNHYIVGVIAGLACVFCFPDNMDKIPNIMPVAGFIVLFTITWIMSNQLKILCSQSTLDEAANLLTIEDF